MSKNMKIILMEFFINLKTNVKHAKHLNQLDQNIVEHVMFVGLNLIIIVFGLDNV
jgi:hypothetical protein